LAINLKKKTIFIDLKILNHAFKNNKKEGKILNILPS